MAEHYIKGKGIFVRTYSEEDLIQQKDLKVCQKETGLEYTNTELIRKNGKVIGIKLYACTAEDFKL